MNRKALLLIAAAAGATVGGVALADGRFRAHAAEAFASMDTDSSESISAPEAQAFFTERAREIDANRDGAVTPEEVKAYHEAQREARHAERFAKLDTNTDGKVSVEEFAAGRTTMMMSRDANGDGQVEPGEGRRGRHHGRRGG